MTPAAHSQSLCRSAALAALLFLLNPRAARAEGSVTYKYEDYRESGGRIAVKTQNALLEQDLGPDMHLKFEGVVDAIAGATPNGQPAPAGSDQVVLAQLDERREGWNANFSRQFPAIKIELGLAHSSESDYKSTAWSVNTLTEFNQKNTTLLAGVAGNSDRLQVFYQPAWADKRGHDLIVGLTQLLSPQTSVTFNFTAGHVAGYLSDQYKLVQKSIQVGPGIFLPITFGENRPDHRNHWIALAALNHAFPTLHGAVDASYRYYRNTFGVESHTLELHWLQHVGPQLVLQPEIRWYEQSAADFYYYQLDATSIIPNGGVPRTQGPFYSSDYRLSDLRSALYGLKAVWTPTARWQFDVAVEHYAMRGRDGVTPQSAYPRAAIVTAGAKFSW